VLRPGPHRGGCFCLVEIGRCHTAEKAVNTAANLQDGLAAWGYFSETFERLQKVCCAYLLLYVRNLNCYKSAPFPKGAPFRAAKIFLRDHAAKIFFLHCGQGRLN
jgi:hypothetical protein